MIIQFSDEEDVYGTIETEESIESIKRLRDEYKKDDEEYNIDDFFEFLEGQKIKFKIIPRFDVDIYF